MNVFSVCGFLLCTLTVNLLLQRLRPEYVPLTVAASGLLAAVYFLREIASSLLSLTGLAEVYGLQGWTELLLKALAIATACRMTASLCRDCGESALAEKAELAGKLSILALTVPVVTQLLRSL